MVVKGCSPASFRSVGCTIKGKFKFSSCSFYSSCVDDLALDYAMCSPVKVQEAILYM